MRLYSGLLVLASLLGVALAPSFSAPARTRARAKPAKAAAKKPSARKRTAVAKAAPKPDLFAKDVLPVMEKYCFGCHGPNNQIAGINFAEYKTAASVGKALNVWENVVKSLQSHTMPPKNLPQPTDEQRAKVVAWIQNELNKVDCGVQDPGRVTMRRLNRAEYNNTVRDLVGLNLRLADSFPSDDVGYGFDNIGDVLSLSPLLMEKYMAAAETIARRAIIAPEDRFGLETRYQAERPQETEGDGVLDLGNRLLTGAGAVRTHYDFPREGLYTLRARVFGRTVGDEAPKMTFRVAGKDISTVEVTATQKEPQVYEVQTRVPAGRHPFEVAFINPYTNEEEKNRDRRFRALLVDYIEVQGPILESLAQLPESHRSIFVCSKDLANHQHTPACAKPILTRFANRAFRRPVKPEELTRLLSYVSLAQKEGESFERGIQLAVQATLVSPHFLFRVELDPDPLNPKASRSLNDWEMATRLSYFLWSSMPDEELYQLASKGQLKKPAVLEAQVRRMLKDPKARALVENFGDQWLTLRTLQNFSPDPKMFPTFNDALRNDMLTETRMFFQAIMQEDRSVLEFLDTNYTFLNERLANHYGIPGVKGENFRRVSLPPGPRGGVLTQASILTITSNPTRTSPVKRGKWVLEQMLGTPPPPPPPDVPELEDDKAEGMLTGTLRQRLEQHRKDPLCASCHQQMDAIGFGLENFSVVGAWRDKDGEHAIDASGELPNGETFEGPADLKKVLKNRKDQFVRALTEKMLTYGLGRGLERYDRCNVDEMAKNVAAKGYRFSAIVLEVVKSEPFRMRRGDGGSR